MSLLYLLLGGRRDYLPLTRRVERGRLFLDLRQTFDSDTLQQIQNHLEAELRFLKHNLASCGLSHTAEAFVTDLAREIETFLDNPDWDVPPSVGTLLSQESADEIRQTCWRCLYLFALPPPLRLDYPSVSFTDEVASHFQMVLSECTLSNSLGQSQGKNKGDSLLVKELEQWSAGEQSVAAARSVA